MREWVRISIIGLMKEMTTAAILVIGDEILSGKTEESNARFLISELRDLGVALRAIMVIPDDLERIATTLADLAARHTYVFTSGGVGPTHDDITILGVSKAFQRPICRHTEVEKIIRDRFGDKVKDSHLRMADLPEGASFINAPGLRWPVLTVENVFILPGVPEFFREKFLAIKERFRSSQFFLKLIYTFQDEFAIAHHMQQVADNYPEVAIGSYPAFDRDDYRVKITIESKQAEVVDAAFQSLKDLLDSTLIVRCD